MQDDLNDYLKLFSHFSVDIFSTARARLIFSLILINGNYESSETSSIFIRETSAFHCALNYKCDIANNVSISVMTKFI